MLKDTKFNNLIRTLCRELLPNAILCYGSYAYNLQDAKSDIDLLILVKNLPSQFSRRRIYKKIAGLKIISMGDDKTIGENNWTLRNDVLDFEGIKIEPGFNTPAWLKKVMTSLLQKNEITCKSMPFRPYTMLGLIETSVILFEKNYFITNIRKKIRPFPLKLKRAIVEQNYSLMNDNYQEFVTNVDRKIGFIAFQFQVCMFVDAVLQLLFVINDVYDPASKRAEALLDQYKYIPKGFLEFVEKTLPGCYHNKSQLIHQGAKIKIFIEKKLKEKGLHK